MTTTDRVPLRISLNPSSSPRRLDGAWWPQSRDLQVECADLIDNVPSNIGRPARLLFSRPDRDAEPDRPSTRRIEAQRGFVKVGSFPEDDTHLVTVILSSRERLELLVIPSSTDTATARTLVAEATDKTNVRAAAVLLAAATTGHANGGARAADATSVNEGGTRRVSWAIPSRSAPSRPLSCTPGGGSSGRHGGDPRRRSTT